MSELDLNNPTDRERRMAIIHAATTQKLNLAKRENAELRRLLKEGLDAFDHFEQSFNDLYSGPSAAKQVKAMEAAKDMDCVRDAFRKKLSS